VLDEFIQEKMHSAGKLRNILDRSRIEYEKFEKRFIKEGGQLGQQYEELKQKQNLLKNQLSKQMEQLLLLAAGPTPLILVEDLLIAIDKQAKKEKEATQILLLKEEIRQRDQRLLQMLKSKVSEKTLCVLKEFIKKDQERYDLGRSNEQYIAATDNCQQQLLLLLNNLLKQIKEDSTVSTKEYGHIKESLNDIDRMLNMVPDENTQKKLTEEMNRRQLEINQLTTEIARLDSEVNTCKSKREEIERKLANEYSNIHKSHLENEDAMRIIKHSAKVRETLRNFHHAILNNNLSRLQGYIQESYLMLLRKKTLVSRLEINPETFELTIYNHANRDIQPGRYLPRETIIGRINTLEFG
jgi:DNA sulfur modification protein DndD